MYLGDTSALVRLYRKQVAPEWVTVAKDGLIRICEPVLIEMLTMASSAHYRELEGQLLREFPWLHVPDDPWSIVGDIRRALAERSQHQGISVADYLVVITALHHDLTVLHEDADFETVARVVPELRQQRISALPAG
jgi:predicted nucleic acid-binding protein